MMIAPKVWADEIWSKGLFMGAAVTQDGIEEIRAIQADARADGIAATKAQVLDFLQRAHSSCPSEAKGAFAKLITNWQAIS